MFPKFWQNIIFGLVLTALSFGNAFALSSPYNQVVPWLTSATRTSDVVSADQTGLYLSGVRVVCAVSAASGTGGLQIKIQGKELVSGTYYDIASTNSLTTTGITIAMAGTGIWNQNPSANLVAANFYMPYTWRIVIKHNDASNYTYTCSYVVMSNG